LERQWAFEMREVLVVGTAAEVDEFLLKAAEVVEELQSMLGITTEWTLATDPFFRPESSGAYLMQRLDPVKYEAVFRSRLAIASTNKHHDHFGRAFGISRNGEPATSGCVAFGLERWLAALVATHGPDATSWPPVLEAIDA
jgi:hypothetical protein